jgi:hypothetical protein
MRLRDLREQFLEAFPSARRGDEIPADLIQWTDFARAEGWTDIEAWARAEHQRGMRLMSEAKERSRAHVPQV